MLLAAIALAVAPLASPIAAHGSTGGTLFAITSTGQQLVRVDPATGTFTQVANLNTPNQPQSTELTSDPQDHRLFAIRTSLTGFDPVFGFPIFEVELMTINSQTGALVFNPAPTFTGPVPNSLVFDTATGTLFGLTFNQIVKVDPATAAVTRIADIPQPAFGVNSITLDSAANTIYLDEDNAFASPPSTQIFPIDTGSGAIGAAITTDTPIRQIGVDSGALYGITECCPANLVGISKVTGATNVVGPVGDSSTIVQFGTAIDPATHNVFVNVGHNDPITFSFISQLLVINDQSGASSTVPMADGVPDHGLAFETPPMITPDSIIQDVRSAHAAGQISNAGVATALINQLTQAKAARSRGQCVTAANLYHAFIATVHAQSGKAIASGTASQLVNEAEFLIANCP